MARRLAWTAAASVLYVGAAFALFSNTWTAPEPSWIGFGGDPAIFAWYLHWTPFALTHGLNPLVSDYLHYPQGFNLMWNTSVILEALLLAPVTAGLGAITAYNTLVTLSLALSALAARWALGRLGFGAAAAFCGGLLYGFSPYMIGQAEGHPNLTLAVFPPVALVALFEIVVRAEHRRRWAVVLGLAGAAQLLAGEELLATTAVVAAVGLGVLGVLHRRVAVERLRAALPALGIAAGIALLLGAYPLSVQFLRHDRVLGVVQPKGVYVSDLLAFVVPGRLAMLSTDATRALSGRFTGGFVENGAYLGLPLLALAAWEAWRHRAVPRVRFFALLTAVITLLSLGPSIHIAGRATPVPLPWVLAQKLPVIANILPGRLALYVSLGVAVLLAEFVDGLPRLPPPRRIAAGGGVAVALLTLLPRVPFDTTVAPVPHFFAAGATRIPEGSVAVVTPYSDGFFPMLWQARANMRFKLAEGQVFTRGPYYGNPPSPLALALVDIEVRHHPPVMTEESRQAILAELRARRVRTVVVPALMANPNVTAFFTWLLGGPPVPVDDAVVWFDLSG